MWATLSRQQRVKYRATAIAPRRGKQGRLSTLLGVFGFVFSRIGVLQADTNTGTNIDMQHWPTLRFFALFCITWNGYWTDKFRDTKSTATLISITSVILFFLQHTLQHGVFGWFFFSFSFFSSFFFFFFLFLFSLFFFFTNKVREKAPNSILYQYKGVFIDIKAVHVKVDSSFHTSGVVEKRLLWFFSKGKTSFHSKMCIHHKPHIPEERSVSSCTLEQVTKRLCPFCPSPGKRSGKASSNGQGHSLFRRT